MERSALELIEAMAAMLRAGERGALATVVRASGSTPQVVGARLLLRADGQHIGTVGGGRVEARVLESLARCVQTEVAALERWDLTRELGMCCGGTMEVLVEPVNGGPRLWLFGAGHVGSATAALAAQVGFHVMLVDEREALLSSVPLPPAQRLECSPDEALHAGVARADDFVLIATHDHHLDEQALHVALRHPHRYVGMVSSRRKALRIAERLTQRHGALPLTNVYAPVGLDLGGATPQEIAVSIVAELMAVRHGRQAHHLRLALDARPAESPAHAEDRD